VLSVLRIPWCNRLRFTCAAAPGSPDGSDESDGEFRRPLGEVVQVCSTHVPCPHLALVPHVHFASLHYNILRHIMLARPCPHHSLHSDVSGDFHSVRRFGRVVTFITLCMASGQNWACGHLFSLLPTVRIHWHASVVTSLPLLRYVLTYQHAFMNLAGDHA
jgi:hypothetical protein